MARYAGSLDCLLAGEDKNGEMRRSLLTSRPCPAIQRHEAIDSQLGAHYLHAFSDNHRILSTWSLVVFSKPGSVEMTVEDPQQCLEAWVDCLDLFKNFKAILLTC